LPFDFDKYTFESFEEGLTYHDFYLTTVVDLFDDNFYYDMLDFITVPNQTLFNEVYFGFAPPVLEVFE